MIFLISFVFFALLPLSAGAAQFSGAYLLQVCEMGPDGLEKSPGSHATCQSYISGVIDYHNVLRSLKIAPKVNICIPDNATLNDLHEIVLVYLRKHGEHDGFVAAPAVTMALYEVFPCK